MNKIKCIVLVSITLMSIVLLITQSIYMAEYAELDVSFGPKYDKAAVGVAFAVIGMVATFGLVLYSLKNAWETNKYVLMALGVTFVFLFIAAVVPMDDQKKQWDYFSLLSGDEKALVKKANGVIYNAAQIFPASLTFLLAGSVIFLGAMTYGINNHDFEM